MKKFMFAAIAAMVMVSVSNVFASSRMVGNAEIAPVDTVAPDAPSDTTEVGTPIKPQATTEDSIQQENTQEETTQQQEALRQNSRQMLNKKSQESSVEFNRVLFSDDILRIIGKA